MVIHSCTLTDLTDLGVGAQDNVLIGPVSAMKESKGLVSEEKRSIRTNQIFTQRYKLRHTQKG